MADDPLDDLQKLLPPPKSPLLTTVDWSLVETELGMPLPEDYKAFISTYGNVILCDRLYVIHPLSNGSITGFRESMIALLSGVLHGVPTGRDQVPYPDYPTPGGLFPVIQIEENLICWITDGTPEQWRILYWAEFGQTVREYRMSLTEFLIDIFRLKSDLFPNELSLKRFDVGSPTRKAVAVPPVEQFQPPGEYYR